MSLFDVIKYPISMPPTRLELETLPTELYMQWISESEWDRIAFSDDSRSAYVISNWYASYHEDRDVFKPKDAQDIHHLRKIITEWETVDGTV